MDADQTKRAQEIVSQIADLGRDGKLVVREALNNSLRAIGLENLEFNIKEHTPPISEGTRDDLELGLLLSTSTQSQNEGEAVMQFISFARSAYVQMFTDFTNCGLLTETLRKNLETENVHPKTMIAFNKLGLALFTALEKAHGARDYFALPHREWHKLRGYTKDEFSKLVERWGKMMKKMQ